MTTDTTEAAVEKKAPMSTDRRLLLIIGVALLVLGLALVWTIRDTGQRFTTTTTCISTSFTDLSTSLNERSRFASREYAAARLESKAGRVESRATAKLDRANGRFYRDAFSATNEAGVFDAYAAYKIVEAQVVETRERVTSMRERVRVKRTQIRADRAANPIPDFPKGTCVRNNDDDPDNGPSPTVSETTEKE